jgi:hypothetical protein
VNRTQLEALLTQVAAGTMSPQEGLEQLRFLPYEDIGFARIDHHRHLRQGVPEVIFCEGKTVDQVRSIGERILHHQSNLLATRVSPEAAEALLTLSPQADYHAIARTVVVQQTIPPPTAGIVLVAAAGTSDMPVAEEAVVTARALGSTVQTVYDVGVAGLHRLLDAQDLLLSQLKICIRVNYSNPPAHGGAIVSTILGDAELRQRWESELAQMRDRIAELRVALVRALKGEGIARDFSFIEQQKGMFSFSGLTKEQVERLKADYAAYVVGSGRINVAALTPDNLDYVVDAITAVCGA